MTSHPNNPQQSPSNYRAEDDMSSSALGMPSLGDITSLAEIEEEDDNDQGDHSLMNAEQEIENLLNDSALFESRPIETSEVSNLNVPTLKESINTEPLPVKAKAKAAPDHQGDIHHIPTLNTEINTSPSPISNSATDSYQKSDAHNLDDNVDKVINKPKQHSQLETPQAEQTPTNQPQDTMAHASGNSHTEHPSISTEQTQTSLQIEESAVEQLASQIDQQLDDLLSTPIETPSEIKSEIQTVPAFEDNNFTHANDPHDADEQPAKPSVHPPLNSAPPTKAALSPHDELHKQLSEKMDQFIVEAAATLTDELNRQLSTRLETIILNSIDTILPSLLEQVGQSLRREVKNNVKQHLPTLINEAMGQTTRVR